jgi:hypothetical protein
MRKTVSLLGLLAMLIVAMMIFALPVAAWNTGPPRQTLQGYFTGAQKQISIVNIDGNIAAGIVWMYEPGTVLAAANSDIIFVFATSATDENGANVESAMAAIGYYFERQNDVINGQPLNLRMDTANEIGAQVNTAVGIEELTGLPVRLGSMSGVKNILAQNAKFHKFDLINDYKDDKDASCVGTNNYGGRNTNGVFTVRAGPLSNVTVLAPAVRI